MRLSLNQFVISFTFVFLGLNAIGQKNKNHFSRKDSINIQVKTFLDLFENNASLKKKNATYYYLSFDDSLKSTMNEVFEKLRIENPKVKLIKEYQELTKSEKEKIKFLSFEINSLRFISRKEVYVSAGYFEGSLSASTNTVVLRKRSGRWRIIANHIVCFS
jgi:hypothetical protein